MDITGVKTLAKDSFTINADTEMIIIEDLTEKRFNFSKALLLSASLGISK